MQEIWKDIDGFKGKYQVSNYGNVKSLIHDKPRLLKPSLTNGYLTVTLSNKKGSSKYLVHRLVAFAFIPNPNNYKEVNHIDEIKTNNCVTNLEWCTRAYNMAYGTARLRQGISRGIPINQYTLNGSKIAWYCSADYACELTGIDCSSILKCCRGKRENAGGYKWEYAL